MSFHTVERSQSQLTLFFVPVASLSGHTVSRCEMCGHRASLDATTAQAWFLPGTQGMQGQMSSIPPMPGQMSSAPPLPGQAWPDPSQFLFVGVGPRFLATLLDGVFLFIFLIIISLLFSEIPDLAALFFFLGIFVYYVVMEAVWGATLGKMILRLRIVRLDGSPIGWPEALVRTLLRLVDGLFGYILGAILMNTSARRQRLGDMAAKTVVIRR
jgi:uncharacterized RDD family membrane protein YckC